MEKTERKSWVSLLGKVVTSPGTAFNEIAGRPAFWPAALTLVMINLIVTIISLPKVQEYSQLMLEKMAETVPAEQLEILARTMSPRYVTITNVIAALVVPWIIWLLLALILKLYAAITAQEAPFRKMFAVSVYGYIPAIIGGIISGILVLNTAAENIQNVNISLAVFTQAESGFLYYFLTACNPFTWWSLILWSIGAAAVMKAKRPTGVFIYLFALWLVFALITGAAGLINVPA